MRTSHYIKIACLVLVVGFMFLDAKAEEGVGKIQKWKLIWSEEFDQKNGKLDATKWTPCERAKSDWSNYMSKREDLYELKNGYLRLTGVVNKDQSKDKVPFLTAGVTSKGKFDFKYGKIEIRAKFKSAQGAWPALWMLGAEKSWPKNGEIDLMEHLNYQDQVYQTVHSSYTVSKGGKGKPQSSVKAKIDREKFNTYGAEWDKDKVVFLVNGKVTMTYPRLSDKGEQQFPFDQPFYIILSMQIEGDWVGKADPKQYPAWMDVDWVRVWQK